MTTINLIKDLLFLNGVSTHPGKPDSHQSICKKNSDKLYGQ